MSRSEAQVVEVTVASDGSQAVPVLPASNVSLPQVVGVSRSGDTQTATVRPSE